MKALALFTFTILLVPTLKASCLGLFSANPVVIEKQFNAQTGDLELVTISHKQDRIMASGEPYFFIKASVENNVFSVHVFLKDNRTRSKLNVVSGLKQSLKLFDGKFTAINEVWHYGDLLQSFNKLVNPSFYAKKDSVFGLEIKAPHAKPFSVKNAIMQSHTYKIFKKLGYSKIKILELEKSENGQYQYVEFQLTAVMWSRLFTWLSQKNKRR